MLSQEIPLSQLILPPDARPHLPEDVASLAEDLKRNGQLQEIVVLKQSATKYLVLAGVGRTLAARKLKWTSLRAFVKENLSDFQRFHITFSENEERDNVSPLYQSYLLKQMLEAEHLTQEQLAGKIGKSRVHITQYLSLSALSLKIHRDVNRFTSLGLRHFLQICRIKNESDQVRIITQAARKDWSVSELTKQVNGLLGKVKKVRGRPPKVAEWKVGDASDITILTSGRVQVQATFSPKQRSAAKFIEDLKKELALFLRLHLNALPFDQAADLVYGPGSSKQMKPDGWAKNEAEPVEMETEPDQEVPVPVVPTPSDQIQAELTLFMEKLSPSDKDLPKLLNEMTKVQLPATSAAQKALEAQAAKNPAAMFAQIYGPRSVYARATTGKSWKDFQVSHPVALCRALVEVLRRETR